MKRASRFLSFALIGGLGFFIDGGVLLAVSPYLGLYYGRLVSFSAAVVATWGLNRAWTFGDSKNPEWRAELARYIGTQSVGALVNLASYASVIALIPTLAKFPLIALALGACGGLATNYFLARRVVFDRSMKTEHMAVGTENLEVMAEARNYKAFLLGLIRAGVPAQGRLLDFGAGIGTFAQTLASEGRDLLCVELDGAARQRLQEQGLQAHASLDAVAPGSVDGLYSLNVLEYIADDRATLRAFYDRLRPGGSLLLYVPAFQWLFTSMDRRVGHLRGYRRADLTAMLREAGFEVRRARYVDSLGVPATLLYRLIGDGNGEINRTALRLYDRWAFPLSCAIDWLTRGSLGKNLCVEARRPGPA